jgi:predicted secreted Zn-dependent protease
MPTKIKTKNQKPRKKIFNISGNDLDALTTILDKRDTWGAYRPNVSLVPKYDKSKKVTEITIALKPVTEIPKWKELSKSTKKRQAEWNRMVIALEKYLRKLYALSLEALVKVVKDLEGKDGLDKAGFIKEQKKAKEAIEKAASDYDNKQLGGYKQGVELADIPPDPPEVKQAISKPKLVIYSVGGKTIEQVFNALNKRKFWGRYRSNQKKSATYQLDGHIKTITVTAKPVITMPKWKNYSKGNKGQKGTWDTMWKKLKAHEDNHHKIFLKCVKSFEEDLKSDNVTKKELPTHWRDETKSWQDDQDDYDSPGQSDHGKNEGVMLDFSHDP